MTTATANWRRTGTRLGDLPPKPEPTPAPLPLDNGQGAEWAGKVKAVLAVFNNLSGHLTPPPDGCNLADLLAILDLLPCPQHDSNPTEAGARAAVARLVWRDYLPAMFEDMLRAVVTGISRQLAAGVDDPRLVDARLFGKSVRLIDSGWMDTNARPIWLAVGDLDALPPDDPRTDRLRSLLPPDEFYVTDLGRDRKGIVLGPAVGQGAREWYFVSEVLRLTKQHRQRQLDKLAEEVEAAKREKVQELRDFERSDIGTLRARLRELDRLEAEGKLPPEPPPPEPAVRRGSNARAELERWLARMRGDEPNPEPTTPEPKQE